MQEKRKIDTLTVRVNNLIISAKKNLVFLLRHTTKYVTFFVVQYIFSPPHFNSQFSFPFIFLFVVIYLGHFVAKRKVFFLSRNIVD